MLLQLGIFFFLLMFLFFLSRRIQQSLYQTWHALTKSKKFAVGVVAAVLLPGTILHELSHLFIAFIVRVPTGELSIFPEIDEKSGEVRAGKLMIAKTDPFRHSLIGLAPILTGIIVITFIGNTFFPSLPFLSTYNLQPTTYNSAIVVTIGMYLLFTISTTMFSSRKDVESLIIAAPLTLLIAGSLYAVGLRIGLDRNLADTITVYLAQINRTLMVSAGLNLIVYVLQQIVMSGVQKVVRVS